MPWLHSHIAQGKLGFPEQTGILFLPTAAPCSPPTLGLARSWLCSSRKMGLTAHGAELHRLGPWGPPASALPTDPGSPIATGCGQFLVPVWGSDGLGQFPSALSKALGLVQGGGKCQQVGCPPCSGVFGTSLSPRAELLLTPRLSILLPCRVLQGKRKELIPLPPFLYSKQLESGTAHGSATLAPAAIEFPLLVTLASGSFTFCKVASLLPCTD